MLKLLFPSDMLLVILSRASSSADSRACSDDGESASMGILSLTRSSPVDESQLIGGFK